MKGGRGGRDEGEGGGSGGREEGEKGGRGREGERCSIQSCNGINVEYAVPQLIAVINCPNDC